MKQNCLPNNHHNFCVTNFVPVLYTKMCPRMQLLNTISNYAVGAQEISQDSVITPLWVLLQQKRPFLLLLFLMAHQVSFWSNKLQLSVHCNNPHHHEPR